MIKRAVIGILILIFLVSGVFAADLSDFPDMFIKGGNADVVVVIGKAAKAEDALGAIDIVVALQQRIGSRKLDIARLDENIRVLSAQNTIIVGGPCANSAAAKLLNYPENCLQGFELGKGYIRLYEFENGKIAMLVAGTVALDTRRTTRVVANYKDYALEGTGMVVSGVSLSDISVRSVG